MARLLDRPWVTLAAVWAVSAVLLLSVAFVGFIPHDDGLLAQGAERVLRGELPHVAFDATYTGGLELLHAVGFKLFGASLMTIRVVLLIASLLVLPALYWLLLRVTSPLGAAVTTIASLLWSLPVYFSGLPSWYILFLAVFGTAALLRFLDTRRVLWLFLAGICGGLAFLVKVPGLYFIAAGVLFLLRVEQESVDPAASDKSSAMSALVIAAAGLVGLAPLVLIRQHPGGAMELVQFALPGAAMAAVVVHRELVGVRGGLQRRVRETLKLLLPFGVGVVLPIFVFLVPYVAVGGVHDFIRGVFILPQKRLSAAAYPLPPLWTVLAAAPLAALLGFGPRLARLDQRRAVPLMAVALVPFLVWGGQGEIYRAVWDSLRPIFPLSAVGAAVVLVRRRSPDAKTGLPLFLVVSVASFVGLMQYPYCSGTYFCYVAPLAALALAYLVRSVSPAPQPLYGVVVGFFLLFAALWVDRGFVRWTGVEYQPKPEMSLLDIPRGGIEIPEGQAHIYTYLAEEIQKHSAPHSYIYALPDCPEVYFLADRLNPTRTFYDFFDADFDGAPSVRRDRILKQLEARGVNVVVLSSRPEFSGPPDPVLVKSLAARYPNEESIATFTLRWR